MKSMKIVLIVIGIIVLFWSIFFYVLMISGKIPSEDYSLGPLIIISVGFSTAGLLLVCYHKRISNWLEQIFTHASHDTQKLMGYTEKQIQEDLLLSRNGKKNMVLLIISGSVLFILSIGSTISMLSKLLSHLL
jgi:hypothetical protein